MSSPPTQFAQDLPVLQRAVDAYKIWHGSLPHLPRLSRYTLGAKIDTLFGETIELIFSASYANREQKKGIIQRASAKLDALKFFLRVAWELKTIDNKRYVRLSEPLVEIGRMLGGWRRWLENDNPSA